MTLHRPSSRIVACLAVITLVGFPGRGRADALAQVPSDVAVLVQRLGLEESPAPVRERAGWRKPRKILVWNVAPEAGRALQAAAPGVELLLAKDALEAAALAKDADAVLGFCSADLLAAGPDIRWIQTFSAEVERCAAIQALRERDVLFTNMQRVAGPVIAEHVLAMMDARLSARTALLHPGAHGGPLNARTAGRG